MKTNQKRSAPSKREELLARLKADFEKLPREKQEILLTLVTGRAERKEEEA